MAEHAIYAPSRGTNLSSLPQSIKSDDHGPFLLWLDDLEGFLGNDGMNPSLLDALTRLHVAIVATMQDELFETYANVHPSGHHAEQEVSRQIGNRLLRAVDPIRISRLWSVAEIERASKSSDERLADAVTHSATYGVSEYLAAGPALMQSWQRAQRVSGNPRGAALVQVCVDLARAGFSGAVDIDVLEELHVKYRLDPTLRPESWSDAVAWATMVQYGVSGLLIPGEYEGTWRAFDYLPDVISRNKRNQEEIPDFIREEALNLCPDEDDRWLIGMNAYMAGATQYAIEAWTPLAENGNGSAASNLVAISREMGDHEAARYWRYLESQDEFQSGVISVDTSVPLYDAQTGKLKMGESRSGELVQVPLHRPGLGVRHGIIIGGKGVGKSNSLSLILVGALSSGKYILWLMDWDPEQKHFKVLKESGVGVVNRFSGNILEHSLKILGDAVRILEVRKEMGGYVDPVPEKPAIIIGLEEAHLLFDASPKASSLCLRILREGASAGVSIFFTLPDVSLESFGGNEELREEATSGAHFKSFMGSMGLSMMRDAVRVQESRSSGDPFD
ncbi:hypothetical protein ACWD4L_08460 [Streptomyces sp. NPDC002596]